MKYIIFDAAWGDYKKTLYVMHHEHLAHSQVFESIQNFLQNGKSEYADIKCIVTPVSAGFVNQTRAGLECFGRSESMNLESRGFTDTVILTRGD